MHMPRNASRKVFCVIWTLVTAAIPAAALAGAPRVLPPGELPKDKRLEAPRRLEDKYHPWAPPSTRAAWEALRPRLQERMLVGMGLWPMPPCVPANPVIHGKIDRGDYTVEKVFFTSHPGFYVTGNLYRPKNVQGKLAGVLCPHGHWQNGRFYELSEEKAQTEQIAKGAEKRMAGARYPLQARMVHLARMGCVVFHYDMVGYADSQQIQHSTGFTDVDSALWLFDFMGLQTFNSMRALDFLISLPEVDPARIGVTGASGGGTQTFVLCALDPRPAAAFPAVMVSTDMQGGCVCENCNYLRIGISNIALTGLFAPKPLAMSAADDWTINIETKGLPELRQIYAFYGKEEFVLARTWREFPHNYNQPARELMYAWFNKHLKLGHQEPIEERDFQPVPPAELSVFDADHPKPRDAVDAEQLKAYLKRTVSDHYARLVDGTKSAEGLAHYRQVVGAAARVMLDNGIPETSDVAGAAAMKETPRDGYRIITVAATRAGAVEQIPIAALIPDQFGGTVVLWIDGQGKDRLFTAQGEITPAVEALLKKGVGVIGADVFKTGEYLPDPAQPITEQSVQRFVGYTFGYNLPLLSQRVRDILTVLGGIGRFPVIQKVHLVGTGGAGPWVLLARALAGAKIEKCLVDLEGFGFSRVKAASDPMMLPGALRYGGIGGLAALAAPGSLMLFGVRDAARAELAPLEAIYQATNGDLAISTAAAQEKDIEDAFAR
jgi:hypothetical protein